MDAADTLFVAAIAALPGRRARLAMCCDIRVCADDAALTA
jgi:hypothetical protein